MDLSWAQAISLTSVSAPNALTKDPYVSYSLDMTDGNLHPLLNGESLNNWPNGEFEKRMSQIWSIFKQMFENGPYFQTSV